MLFRSLLTLCTLLLLTSCGYHSPYAGLGNESSKTLYLSIWANQTNEIGLEADVFVALNRWFKKNRMIQVTQDPGKADLILEGTITSVNRPGVSFSQFDQAQEIRAILNTSFTLKRPAVVDQDNVIWKVDNLELEQSYAIGANEQTAWDNKDKALAEIIENLSEYIYHQVLSEMRNSGLSEQQD